MKKQGLLRFNNKTLNGEETLQEIVTPIFGSVSVANNFISVSFDDQRHLVQIDGTPIGFTFEEVDDE